jgi:hypothetical protein
MNDYRTWLVWMWMPGLLLLALGWGLHNYYLVAAGSLLLCGAVATLTIPRPPRDPGSRDD